MKNINFLPERYHERELKRRAAIWQYGLLAAFAGMLVAATLAQGSMKHSLQASVDELEAARITTNQKREQLALLRQRLDDSIDVAALYTYLRHPWPRTQLLAQITESLPESVVLAGVEILETQPDRSTFASPESRQRASDETSAARDLTQLRELRDSTQLVVRIRGTVDDTTALNEYVRQLGDRPLFRRVALSSLQSEKSRGVKSRSAFELNVIVCPGHGQPGGPSAPLLARDQVARLHSGRTSQ